jgi:hypothetical protein
MLNAGGGGSLERTSLRPISLLNREKTGNFREYGLQIADPHGLSHWILGLFREIP